MHLSNGLAAHEHLRPLHGCHAPQWALALADGAGEESFHHDGFDLTLHGGEAASLLRLLLPGALLLDAPELERRTVAAYRCIRSMLADLPHAHPVRFWNFVPRIGQMMDGRRDRYMVFNAGRFAAFDGWFGAAGNFSSALPAASAVGHGGDELVICCLAMDRPGAAIENPRQISSFGYSARYGPRPPCFARATLVNISESNGGIAKKMLASGTASILGEHSVHRADLKSQLEESLTNLRSLLAAADRTTKPELSAFESLRIYHPRAEHADAIAAAIPKTFGPRTEVELIRADLCRPELLVEIEGIASLAESAL